MDRDELRSILEAYVNQDFLPYTKHVPDAFYQQLFRLRGWKYNPNSVKRPKLVGKLTAELLYKKLPVGVIDELRQKNPVIRNGQRRYKHFQYLTPDIGCKHLERHLAAVTTLMRISNTWSGFMRMFDKAFPSERYHPAIPGLDEEDNEQ